jgi:hypothetical protein
MRSLTDRLRHIAERFGLIGTIDSDHPASVHHYEKPANTRAPYLVWAEGGEPAGFSGDSKKGEQAIGGTLDLYTLTEFDPLIDEAQDALAELFGSSWALDDVLYEDETKLIHYAWRWEDS